VTDAVSEPENAADAFNALRTEVAVGLQRVELALRRLAEPQDGNDDDDMLGHIAEQLIATRSVVETIAASPALRPRDQNPRQQAKLPPETLALVDELGRLLRAGRNARRQRDMVVRTTAGTFVLGVVAWATCAGAVARTMPAAWHWPERMAARTLRADMPDAGVRLLRAADPLIVHDLIAGGEIVAANRSAIEHCLDQARRSRMAQGCLLTIDAP
jgi:hypothetical protein